MRTRSYAGWLGRGVLAGGLAGLAAGIVGLIVVEPLIRSALVVEEARSAAAGDSGHDEMFSRGVQVVGGVAAAVLVGLAIGAIFGTVLAAARSRWPDRGPFAQSLTVAALGFAAVALVPGVKYPANPPGVGDPGTVDARTTGYLTMIAAGLAISYGLVRLERALAGRAGWSPGLRGAAVAGAAAAGLIFLLVAWPGTADAVPADISATLLWEFRLASVAELATMWLVLGVSFGLLTEDRADNARQPQRAGVSRG